MAAARTLSIVASVLVSGGAGLKSFMTLPVLMPEFPFAEVSNMFVPTSVQHLDSDGKQRRKKY